MVSYIHSYVLLIVVPQHKVRQQVEQLTITTKPSNEQPTVKEGQLKEIMAEMQSLQQSVVQLQQGLINEQQKICFTRNKAVY